MKTQFFIFMNYDIKGYWRSHKVNFLFKNLFFPRYLSCLKSDLIKINMNANIIKTQFFYIMEFDLKGH